MTARFTGRVADYRGEVELGVAQELSEARGRALAARAVGKVQALLPWTAPFAKRGGRLLLIKGERADQELGEAHKQLRRFRCTHETTVLTPTGRILVLRVG